MDANSTAVSVMIVLCPCTHYDTVVRGTTVMAVVSAGVADQPYHGFSAMSVNGLWGDSR